jgi:hypothetical protein
MWTRKENIEYFIQFIFDHAGIGQEPRCLSIFLTFEMPKYSKYIEIAGTILK